MPRTFVISSMKRIQNWTAKIFFWEKMCIYLKLNGVSLLIADPSPASLGKPPKSVELFVCLILSKTGFKGVQSPSKTITQRPLFVNV